jgi:hypothetical protein
MDGDRVRLWARTTSDYSKAFTRIRDAVAALPVESAVLDGEAIVMRSADRSDFEALRSRQGQAEAILVTYARVLDGPRRHRLEAGRVALCQRADAGVVEDEEPEF